MARTRKERAVGSKDTVEKRDQDLRIPTTPEKLAKAVLRGRKKAPA